MRRRHAACIVFAVLLAACGEYSGGSVTDVEPPPVGDGGTSRPIDLSRGRALFLDQCTACHGSEGQGGRGPSLRSTASCASCADYDGLWRFIEDSMPQNNAALCQRDCARDVAAYILNGFTTEPSCTLVFAYEQLGSDRFVAAIELHNLSDREVSGWRVDFTFPEDQVVSAARGAAVEQDGAAVIATSVEDTAQLPAGARRRFELEGVHGGTATEPTDLRLEAPPCFAAAP